MLHHRSVNLFDEFHELSKIWYSSQHSITAMFQRILLTLRDSLTSFLYLPILYNAALYSLTEFPIFPVLIFYNHRCETTWPVHDPYLRCTLAYLGPLLIRSQVVKMTTRFRSVCNETQLPFTLCYACSWSSTSTMCTSLRIIHIYVCHRGTHRPSSLSGCFTRNDSGALRPCDDSTAAIGAATRRGCE